MLLDLPWDQKSWVFSFLPLEIFFSLLYQMKDSRGGLHNPPDIRFHPSLFFLSLFLLFILAITTKLSPLHSTFPPHNAEHLEVLSCLETLIWKGLLIKKVVEKEIPFYSSFQFSTVGPQYKTTNFFITELEFWWHDVCWIFFSLNI